MENNVQASLKPKLIDFSLKSALVACFLLSASAGSIAAEQPQTDFQRLASDEAFVLVKTQRASSADSYQAGFSLSANSQKLKLNIQSDSQMQLLKVKAGIYTPSVAGNSQRKRIVVNPGTVTYIGDWKLYNGQQFLVNGVRHTTNHQGYRVNFDVDNLFSFADQNDWLKQYPLHIAHINGKRVANKWVKAES